MNIAIRNTRDKLGLTQVQVAEKAGIGERYYQYIEADKRKPNVYTAIKIAKALKSTVENLWS